jgi:inorganic triphosphatase YgiF
MSWSGRELEIKFSTDAAGLAAAWESGLLAGVSETAGGQSLRSIYFDTAGGALRKQGKTLRIRRTGRSDPMMTLKWLPSAAEGPFARGETEVRNPGSDPNIDLFDEPVAAELKKAIDGHGLEPQFETQFKRRTRIVVAGAAKIEAAFDGGEILGGERRLAFAELELELKGGEPADLYDLAARVVESLPLRLEMSSKSRRGFLLARGERPLPVKAWEPQFSHDASFDDVVAGILDGCLRHFLANWASLRDDVHPEAIHQMRVALRRMRSLIALFSRHVACPEFAAFRAEARRIATNLGPARECDAFDDFVAGGPAAHFSAPEVFEPLKAAVDDRRNMLHAEARAMINGSGCALFALKLQAFLARRRWRNGLASDDLQLLTQPAKLFAAEALERLHHRALRRGKGLAVQSDDERHQVRIALKNLRYATEFFGGFFARSQDARALIRVVSGLQDLLGAHNDAASAKVFLDQLRAAERAETALAAGIVLGWLANGVSNADRDLLKAWRSFQGMAPFWR